MRRNGEERHHLWVPNETQRLHQKLWWSRFFFQCLVRWRRNTRQCRSAAVVAGHEEVRESRDSPDHITSWRRCGNITICHVIKPASSWRHHLFYCSHYTHCLRSQVVVRETSFALDDNISTTPTGLYYNISIEDYFVINKSPSIASWWNREGWLVWLPQRKQ